jgi:DNA-binding CsgD family transcriptional regulator
VSLLVAGELTNGAVVRRLCISPQTVNTHLRHMFAKLGVPDRVALAAVAHHSIKRCLRRPRPAQSISCSQMVPPPD